jgi:hypothetical protein
VRLFEELKAAPILLDVPDLLVEGSRVTQLRYQVRRSDAAELKKRHRKGSGAR